MEYPELVLPLRIHPDTSLEVMRITESGELVKVDTTTANDYVQIYGQIHNREVDFCVRLVDLPGNRLFRLVSTNPCLWREVLTREDEYPQDYWVDADGHRMLEHQKHLFPKEQESVPTKTFLQRAQEIAYGQRKIDYGPALENLQRIADLWSPILGVKVTAEQVCLAMIQVKVSRLCHTPEHEDSWVDIAGYVAVKDKINSGE